MPEVSETCDVPKKITDFYCHKMNYTLFWGGDYCISCSKRKFMDPGRSERQAVEIHRHFLISEPRPNQRICSSCRHPLMFVCHAQYCPDCCEFYRRNTETLEYEDGCVDVPPKSLLLS